MPPASPVLEVEGLAAAGDGVPVLTDVTFSLAPGELFSLLGPNGSGKTTLLRCLAGLEPVASGRVRLDGVDLGARPTHRRGIGLLSQEPALFPRRTVLENIAYAPLLQRRPEAEARAEVRRLVELLRLEGFEDRRPEELSGGERQRVALARTLAARPRVVLLDEPFAAIDVERRAGLRAEFRRVLAELGTATVHVTHDREDGMFLGDRMGLLVDGRLEAVGPPGEVFAHPPSVRSARLLGYNVLERPGRPVAVHPDDVELGAAGAGRADATVLAEGPTGRGRLVVPALAAGHRLAVRRAAAALRPSAGSRVAVGWAREIELPAADGPKEPKRDGNLGQR